MRVASSSEAIIVFAGAKSGSLWDNRGPGIFCQFWPKMVIPRGNKFWSPSFVSEAENGSARGGLGLGQNVKWVSGDFF